MAGAEGGREEQIKGGERRPRRANCLWYCCVELSGPCFYSHLIIVTVQLAVDSMTTR